MARYWDDLERHVGGQAIDEIWLNHPLVRAEVNRRISGDAGQWPSDWLRAELIQRTQLPLENSVSIGCGTGAFERDLVSKAIVNHIIGVDVAEQAVDRARDLAAHEGVGDRVAYVCSDAVEFLRANNGRFDAVLFHASLHHFAAPRELLGAVRSALRENGWLYADEYVGPARDHWNPARLLLPNLAYYALPRAVRRPRVVRAPINREDATEAIASASIIPAIRSQFQIVVQKPYGGNLLSVIYPNLNRQTAQFDRAVSRLLKLENALMRARVPAYYVAVLAQK